MSKAGSNLYEKVKNSTASARIQEIIALREYLLDIQNSTADLLLGLKQNQNDIRKTVLDVLSERSSREQHGKTFLVPVIDILRGILQSSSNFLSTTRTIASALKYLCINLKQDGPDTLSNIESQEILDIALRCLSLGLSKRTHAFPAERCNTFPRINGPGSAFAFGTPLQNGFKQKTLNLQKRSSSSSLASKAPTSASAETMYDTDTSTASDYDLKESDDAEKRQARLVETQKSVRYRSIACISALNERASRFLLIHWHRLIIGSNTPEGISSLMLVVEKDDCLKNRIGAIHTIQNIVSSGAQAGFMAGAEERSQLSAFTSLSGTIASAIVDLRKHLLRLMLDKTCPLSLLEAVIKCAKVLVAATSLVKLKISHSQYLQSATLQLCSRSESNIAVPAYNLLSALASGVTGKSADLDQSGILSTLRDAKKPLEIRVGAWKALTASKSNLAISNDDLSSTIEQALSSESPLELREAAAAFTLSRLHDDSTQVDADIVEALAQDESPIIRAIAADCLALIGNEESILLLFKDRVITVRAAAIRAIGVNIQKGNKGNIGIEQFSHLLYDESLLVRIRASWTLGNLCEEDEDYIDHLRRCYSLHQDDEKVSINAIRGAGAVLSNCPAQILQQSPQLIRETLTWLTLALSNTVPKVRWNAAACFSRVVATRSKSDLILSMSENELIQILGRCLVEDKAFKVRLSIAQVLLTLLQYETLISSQIVELVHKAVEEAIVKVQEEMKEASFKEIQLHALPLQQSLNRLKASLSSQREPFLR